jgi:lysozyme
LGGDRETLTIVLWVLCGAAAVAAIGVFAALAWLGGSAAPSYSIAAIPHLDAAPSAVDAVPSSLVETPPAPVAPVPDVAQEPGTDSAPRAPAEVLPVIKALRPLKHVIIRLDERAPLAPLETDRSYSGEVFSGNYPKPHDYPIHGIDVSKFQGDIDWNAVASSGVKFAWIKATEGGDRADARFQANWEGAKAAGIPHGAYHFVYWCRAPLEEIIWFEQNAPVEDDALPPVLDVETTPTSPTCHRHLTRDGAVADMKVMLEEMERHYGKRPIIYTTVDFYQAILSDGAFRDYPIWVRSTKYHPAVKYAGRAWGFWQYQSDARVPGIGGNVDKDAFYGTKEQWDAFLREPRERPRVDGRFARPTLSRRK